MYTNACYEIFEFSLLHHFVRSFPRSFSRSLLVYHSRSDITMYGITSLLKHIQISSILLVIAQGVEGSEFYPRSSPESMLQRRQGCLPATPDVSEAAVSIEPIAESKASFYLQFPKIFNYACAQNPQNSNTTCYNELFVSLITSGQTSCLSSTISNVHVRVTYANESAAITCTQYYTQYRDCLVLQSNNQSACIDSHLGYVDCSNYT